jgi:hypothetical protein
MRLNVVNSSKPHWLDRKPCTHENSSNRGFPVRRCGVSANMKIATKEVYYFCKTCKKEFHETGDKFRL